MAAQAAGAAQLGSNNLRKRGRRRGSAPPSVPGPQTSASATAVGQEGRRFPSGPLLLELCYLTQCYPNGCAYRDLSPSSICSEMKESLSSIASRRCLCPGSPPQHVLQPGADNSAAHGTAQPRGTPDPASAPAEPMPTAAAENGSLPASAAAGPLLYSISEGAEVPEADRSRARRAAEGGPSHGSTSPPGGSPPCTGPGGRMDDEAACRNGQEAAAQHASDMQEEVGIAEAASRPGACRQYSSAQLSWAQSEHTELFVVVKYNLLWLEAMSHM